MDIHRLLATVKTVLFGQKSKEDDKKKSKGETDLKEGDTEDSSKGEEKTDDKEHTDDTLPGSYIPVNKIHGVGPNETGKFIYARAPMEDTVADFWQMIVQEGANQIILLCPLLEITKEQRNECAPYFPQEKDKPIVIGHMTIHLRFVKPLENRITQRRLMVEIAEPGQDAKHRFLDHYHYDAWPQHFFPIVEDGLELFLLLQAMNETWKDHHKPVVIQSFAGLGRPGAFILLDHTMTKLENAEEVNLRELYRSVRRQMAGCEMTFRQYIGVRELLAEKAISEGLVERSEMEPYLTEWKSVRDVEDEEPPTPNGSKESTSEESIARKESVSQERAK